MQSYIIRIASMRGRYFRNQHWSKGRDSSIQQKVKAANLSNLRKRIVNDKRIWNNTDVVYVFADDGTDYGRYLGLIIAYQLKTRAKGIPTIMWRKHTRSLNGDPEYPIDPKTGGFLKEDPFKGHPMIMAAKEIKWQPWKK